MDEDHSSDEEVPVIANASFVEDLNTFYENYEEMKKSYITKPFLNKYERTKIISERAQQLANGSVSFLKNPKDYQNVYEIMKALKTLTFGIYNFNKLPEHMNMGKKFNYAQTFDSTTNLFEFNDEENKNAESFLIKNNINNKNFICFIVRTAEYNKIYGTSVQVRREDSMFKFRNVKPEAYIPALKYLVDSGNIVIRMGKGFSNPFPFKHNNFIDYANSVDRSDFLDIWLSANCKFFFGTSTGIICLPALFNKPYLATNQFPIGLIASYMPNSVYLPSIAKKEKQFLSLKEQVELDVIRQINGIYYDKNGIEVLENEPGEILNAVKDMENKIINGFFVNDLNMKFWQNMKKEWNSELIPKNRAVRKKSFFEDFHKINGINATIPDFYLNKYSDLFLNY